MRWLHFLSRTAAQVQMRGFNKVSYADIANELWITTASLHHHFPGKADLGQALIIRYGRLHALATGTSARKSAG